LALRTPLSRSLDEWLTYAQRVPAGIFYDEDGRELPGIENNGGALKQFTDGRTFFDKDATQTLNHSLPVSLLIEVAASEKLPLHLRRELALMAWVRAAVLDDTESGKKLAPIVASLIPALQQNLDAYLKADKDEARKFAAVLLILRFPGTRPYIGAGVSRLTPLEEIDGYRDNWWCSFAAPGKLNTHNFLKLNSIPPEVSDSSPTRIAGATAPQFLDFLDQAQQKIAAEEWQQLSNLGAAPSYLSWHVIDWAQKHPDDPRVPEALHLAVRSTRYGCVDAATSYSKQAFQLLHRRYPDSSWAKKTPYWY
jgi:hypothetical protein